MPTGVSLGRLGVAADMYMVGAVKDDFTGFGGTLTPLGWCVDTAGYGGHHTRLRKNDIIAVLADLDEEYLIIWVNGKQVFRTSIDGSIRLELLHGMDRSSKL